MKNKSAILQMLYGQKGNSDTIKSSDEYHKILDILCEQEQKLQETLTKLPEIIELYNKVDNLRSDLHLEELNIYFKEAFRFGVLLGIEIASEWKKAKKHLPLFIKLFSCYFSTW